MGPRTKTKNKTTDTSQEQVDSDRRRFNYTAKKTKTKTTGDMEVETTISPFLDYESVRRVEVSIYLQLDHEDDAVEIGEIVAFVVDKSKKTAKGKPAWIQELLREGLKSDEDDSGELHSAMTKIFTKAGLPRAALRDHENELQSGQILYIDSFTLHSRIKVKKGEPKREAGQGRGIGYKPLGRFLVRMKALCARENEEIVSILSPASSGVDNPKGYSLLEIEQRLKASYEKSGFETLIQGDEEEEESATYMGRLL
jgi:hypothetical protein